MSDTAIYNDGGMAYGSQIVTIAAQAYILESGSFDADSNIVETQNEKGIPNKQVLSPTNPTGSGTLQLESDAVKPPPIHSTFSIILIGGDTVTVIVKKVGQAIEQAGAKKVSIDFVKKINP